MWTEDLQTRRQYNILKLMYIQSKAMDTIRENTTVMLLRKQLNIVLAVPGRTAY